MVNFDYAQARLTAQKIIAKFGQAGQFILAGDDGGYDDFGNVVPAQPDTIYNGTVTPLLKFNSQEIDGEQIQSADSFVFFHTDTPPVIGAVTTINSSTYRVVNVWRLDSVDNINVYIKLQLRR